MVANSGNKPQRLHKWTILAHAQPHPVIVGASPFTMEEVLGIHDMTLEPQATDLPAVAGDLLPFERACEEGGTPVLDHVPPEWREQGRARLA